MTNISTLMRQVLEIKPISLDSTPLVCFFLLSPLKTLQANAISLSLPSNSSLPSPLRFSNNTSDHIWMS